MKKNENTVTLKAKWKDLTLFSAKIKDKQLLLHKLDPTLINQVCEIHNFTNQC